MSRIDSGTILVAFFAILFGLIGAFLLRKSLRAKKEVVQPAPQVQRAPVKITVPLASRDLKSGTQITLDDIALFRLTREQMKENGIKRVFMSNPDQIIGKIVAVDLDRGATFDTKDFYSLGTGPGIADKLQPGQRAVTIEVTETSALLGFAGAGQNVDVLFHFGQNWGPTSHYGNKYDPNDHYSTDNNTWRPPHHDYNAPSNVYTGGGAQYGNRSQGGASSKYQSATVTLVQKATILALGQRAVQTENSSQLDPQERVRVTLAVSPESAELIRVAEGHGELSLTLRGANDDGIVETDKPSTLANIITIEEPTIEQPPRREVRDIDIYRGQNHSQVQFTRDRDTGTDDFQRWTLLPSKQPTDAAGSPRQSDPFRSEPTTGGNRRQDGSSSRNNGSATSNNSGSSSRNPGYSPRNAYPQNNYPNGILIEDEQWSAQQRLESDFRKIRTLFNRNPELRDRLNAQPPRRNIDAPRPVNSEDLSTKPTASPRSAKLIELYDPRSWE